jgi:hypothetical protein
MEDLEKQKDQSETRALKVTKRRDTIRFIVEILQGLSIIAGVILAVNEFVLKDRESQNQRSKVTLEYVRKATDQEILAARDSLRYFRDVCYAMPVGDPKEDSLFEAVFPRFDKATMPLSHYYNVLNSGIVSGYFDRQICNTFLAADLNEIIDLLSELQSRHDGFGRKGITPDYKRFKGLILFFIQSNNIQERDLENVPQYDLNKPA